jgi:hypothetical protein
MLCFKIRNEVAKLPPQTRSPPLHVVADANPVELRRVGWPGQGGPSRARHQATALDVPGGQSLLRGDEGRDPRDACGLPARVTQGHPWVVVGVFFFSIYKKKNFLFLFHFNIFSFFLPQKTLLYILNFFFRFFYNLGVDNFEV